MRSEVIARRPFIKTLLIGSSSMVLGINSAVCRSKFDHSIKVSMIYNNDGSSTNLESKWGLSIIIENEQHAILFDTGGEPEVLNSNIKSIDFDINKITDIVISHNHLDHVNGLTAITENAHANIKIHVPEFELEDIRSRFPNVRLEGVTNEFQINDFAWTTGQLTGSYKSNAIHEQSIVVKHEDRIFVFTGCSHPGIVNIVEKAKLMFPDHKIELVAGGFHMLRATEKQVINISDTLQNLGVENIGPSHCTGDKAIQIFRERWNENFMDFDLDKNQILI